MDPNMSLFSPSQSQLQGFQESDPDQQLHRFNQSLHLHDHSNPFATMSFDDHSTNHSGWFSDSDADSMSCFVTDLFESQQQSHSHRLCSDDINPFSGVDRDVHGEGGSSHAELGLGFGVESENSDGVFDNSGSEWVRSHMGGLRVVGFGSDSDSSSEGELDGVGAMEFGSGGNGDDRIGGGFDDFDVGLCWDSLCLEDQRTLNENFEWEEVEERVHEREDLSVVIDGVDDQSVASGFSSGEDPSEEAWRYLEWEILLAVNNLERNAGLDHDANADSYLTVQDSYIYTAEYDILFGQFLENENALKGSPPAGKSVVENLPLVELTKEDLQEKNMACAVCRDEILLEEKVRRLPCSHCYHGDCIIPWLSIRNTCPVCRFELPTDDPDYEQRKSRSAAHDLLEFGTQSYYY